MDASPPPPVATAAFYPQQHVPPPPVASRAYTASGRAPRRLSRSSDGAVRPDDAIQQQQQQQRRSMELDHTLEDDEGADPWSLVPDDEHDAAALAELERGGSALVLRGHVRGSEGDASLAQHSKRKKPFADFMQSTMVAAKAKVYNMYKNYPREAASFTMQPVVLLGARYVHPSHQATGRPRQLVQPVGRVEELECTHPSWRAVMEDFHRLTWITYRSHFPPLHNTDITTDMGWGCMIRTSQMMVAEALHRLFLGREWRLNAETDMHVGSLHYQIVAWFRDSPGPMHPYSLHNYGEVAMQHFKRKMGEWFEPSTVSHILKILVRSHSPGSATVYVVTNGCVVKDKAEALCTATRHSIESPPPPPRTPQRNSNAGNDDEKEELQRRRMCEEHLRVLLHRSGDDNDDNNCGEEAAPPEDGTTQNSAENGEEEEDPQRWRPLLLVVPVRLGLQSINPIYFRTLKLMLTLPHTLGIMGGRPQSSFYFVGYQDNHLLYLDPHLVQQTPPSGDFSVDSYHCTKPLKMHISNIDPSMALCFYCHGRAEFEELCARLSKIVQDSKHPFIDVMQRDPALSKSKREEGDGETVLCASSSASSTPSLHSHSGPGQMQKCGRAALVQSSPMPIATPDASRGGGRQEEKGRVGQGRGGGQGRMDDTSFQSL